LNQTVREQAQALDPLPKIIRRIPRECFSLTPWRSVLALFLDFLTIGFLMFLIVQVGVWYFALPLALLTGTAMTGLFVLGHDAGHRSFSYSEKVNNFFGHIATTPLLWPFHVWRLSHDVHHKWTHHIEKEIAWKPFTVSGYQNLPYVVQVVYKMIRRSMFFWASIFFQGSYICDGMKGRFFSPEDISKVRFSLFLTLLVAVFYISVSFWVAGFYGFIWLFLVPQLTYHFWLSTFTFFHHTNKDNRLMSAEEWSPERAQLANTVHVVHHPLVDFLTHDISWHVPHHVCVGIPFYHLRKAHGALKNAYPQWVVERVFGWELIKEVTQNCHLVEGNGPGEQEWLTFDKAQKPVGLLVSE
jgi:omega-6 fatty acid desaturase (delta-12 desaturase)